MDANNFQLIPSADWSAARDALIGRMHDITKVATDGDLEIATRADADAKKLLRALETARKGVTSKLDAVKKNIMAQQKNLSDALVKEEERINRLCVAYATEKERQRQEELRRAEEERRREAEAAAAAAAAAAASADDPNSPDYDPFGAAAAEFEPPPPPPVIQTTVQRPRSDSASFVKLYKFEVIDEAAVPRQYLMVDERRIRSYVEFQKSQGVAAEDIAIPGVRVFAEMSVRSR